MIGVSFRSRGERLQCDEFLALTRSRDGDGCRSGCEQYVFPSPNLITMVCLGQSDQGQ